MIQIRVEDSGIGIKQEDKDKLFKLFGFLDASKELNAKGVGLGLHISQKISEEFGGKILLESEFGVGSTFTCLFDLEKPSSGKLTIKRVLNPIKKQY
jgi:signal transduction histidine kinase